MSRWDSEGSALNLKESASASASASAPKKADSESAAVSKRNYQADSAKTTLTPKSKSMASLSLLSLEVKKYQAPSKPVRRTSSERKTSRKKDLPNLFQEAMMEIQKCLEQDDVFRSRPKTILHSDSTDLCQEFLAAQPTVPVGAPRRPCRRDSLEQAPET